MYFNFNGHHQMSLTAGPQMNKFGQVSSDHHQMSLAGWRQDQGGPRSDVGGGREILGLISGGGGLVGCGCTVRSNA